MTVLAADTWPTNADLIAEVVRLHCPDATTFTTSPTTPAAR